MNAWSCPACGPVSPDEVTVTADSPDDTELHACGQRAQFDGWPARVDVRHTVLSFCVLAI